MPQTSTSGARRKPPRNPAAGLVDQFSDEFGELGKKLVRDIKASLKGGVDVRAAVEGALVKNGVRQKITDSILDKMVTASAIGFGLGPSAKVADPIGIRRTFLDRAWARDGLSLSQRVNRLEFREQMVDTIQSQLRAGKSWQELAGALREGNFTQGNVGQYLERLEASARQVAAGDGAAVRAFKTDLARAKRQIEKLGQAGAPNQALKASYRQVAKAAEDLNAAGLDKAMHIAVEEKARHNAERIARTEIAKAYGDGFHTRIAADTDVIGFQWRLSSRHPAPDICDFHAEADLYGMGKGVYPKGLTPPYPAHPHCMCVLFEVFDGEAETNDRMDPEAGRKYLEGLSEEKRRMLLGAQGAEEFRRDPSGWQRNLRQWQGHRRLDTGGLRPEQFRKPQPRPVPPALPGPAGTPVSEALEMPGGRIGPSLQETIRALDSVHGDGALPKIAVTAKGDDRNAYGYYVPSYSPRPTRIDVRPSGSHPGLTLVHEIGHFLDDYAVGTRGKWASQVAPEFAEWREVVRSTPEYRRLLEMRLSGVVEHTFPDGTRRILRVNTNHAEYLTSSHELWARSYAQYIATKSGDATLMAQLDGIRNDPQDIYPRQWSDANFRPILGIIDRMFEGLGWRR